MKDGGPAFPGTTSPSAAEVKQVREDMEVGLNTAHNLLKYRGGMSLRDYFAATALPGILTARDDHGRCAFCELSEDEIARAAYRQADAMLKARERD